MCEPAVCFQPLSEALRILKLEKQSPMCDGEDLPSQMGTGSPQVFLCNNSGFTESMSSEVPPKRHQETEDFKSLSPEHVQGERSLLFYCLLKGWSGTWDFTSFLKNIFLSQNLNQILTQGFHHTEYVYIILWNVRKPLEILLLVFELP